MTRKSNAGFRTAPFSLKVAIMDTLRAPGILRHYPEGDYDFSPGFTDASLAEDINARLQPAVPCTSGMVANARLEMFGATRKGRHQARAAEENRAAREAATAKSGASNLIEAVHEALAPDREIIAALQRVEAKLDRLVAEWTTPAEHG